MSKEVHRYCIDGIFSSTEQQPMCVYDKNGNYSAYTNDNVSIRNGDQITFNYNPMGNNLNPNVSGEITKIRVPPNGSVTITDDNSVVLLRLGGSYLRDVSDTTFDTFDVTNFVSGIKNIDYKIEQTWDNFTNDCQKQSIPASQCQNFQSSSNNGYNSASNILYNVSAGPQTVVYGNRWILYLILLAFGLIILLIVGVAGYKFYFNKNKESDEEEKNDQEEDEEDDKEGGVEEDKNIEEEHVTDIQDTTPPQFLSPPPRNIPVATMTENVPPKMSSPLPQQLPIAPVYIDHL
jgi:hypothetical protein